MDTKSDDSNITSSIGKKSFVDKILSTSIEIYVGSTLFILVFFIILIQIFSRELAYTAYLLNIPLNFSPPIWTEEAARWCWVWIIFIMLGCLEKIDGHLKVLFLLDKMPKKIADFITMFLDIVYLATVILLFKLSITQVIRMADLLPVTLPFTNFWLYVSLPLGLVFVLIRVFFRIVGSIKKLVGEGK